MKSLTYARGRASSDRPRDSARATSRREVKNEGCSGDVYENKGSMDKMSCRLSPHVSEIGRFFRAEAMREGNWDPQVPKGPKFTPNMKGFQALSPLTGYPEKLLKGNKVTPGEKGEVTYGSHSTGERLTSRLLPMYHALYGARGRRPSSFVILRLYQAGGRLLRCAFSLRDPVD